MGKALRWCAMGAQRTLRRRDTDVTKELEHDILFGRLGLRERLVDCDIIARLHVTRHQVSQALGELTRTIRHGIGDWLA
jgi:DNA-binding GntR family transcriptional regulator